MNLTKENQKTLLDELLHNGVHFLLHNGELGQRYTSVPFGHKETALDAANIESGEAGT